MLFSFNIKFQVYNYLNNIYNHLLSFLYKENTCNISTKHMSRAGMNRKLIASLSIQKQRTQLRLYIRLFLSYY